MRRYDSGMTKTRRIAVATALLALLPLPARAEEQIISTPAALTPLETIGIFVLAPATLYGVIWLLWSIPHWRRQASAPTTGEQWNPTPGQQ